MDMGESINIATIIEGETKEEKKKAKKKVNVRCGVFFDGTLNNQANIDVRLVSEYASNGSELTDEEVISALELINKKNYTDEDIIKSQKIYKRQKGKDNSYLGYYTNIVKLEQNIELEETEDLVKFKTYIEGPGTRNEKDDDLRGYAFGKGKKSGVKKKVEEGIKDIVSQVTEKIKKDKVIELLTVDVFGFSRGAAGARYFIHVLLEGDGKYVKIKERLKDKGYQIETVEVCFAGLFDTVSSYGFSLFGDSYANNTEELKLKSVRKAKHVIQLAAADEHRENFSLTNINCAFNNGSQIFLPGAHSDIGGGYRDMGKEMQIVFKTTHKNDVESQVKYLVDSGWYNKNQLKIKTYHYTVHKRREKRYVIEAKRDKIKNEYSKIPLHIMAEQSRKNTLKIDGELERNENISSDLLRKVKKDVDAYVENISNNKYVESTASDWEKKDYIKKLRFEFLHFSARYEIGHGPRIDGGVRHRKQYEG